MATQKKTNTTKTDTPAKKLPKYHYALGRRKTAVATVRLFESAGESMVNDKQANEAFPGEYNQHLLTEPFKVADLDPKKFHVTVKVKGSGKSAQLGAVRHALARALVKMDENLKKPLKKAGLMTRDPRMVERKKPGLHKARKAEQFSKR